MEILKEIYALAAHNRIIQLVIVSVISDSVFGLIRAAKERKINSSIGIDGITRKISMIISIMLLAVVDYLVQINLIGFVPTDLRQFIGLEKIGLTTFFGLLYLGYEIVSVLKNMTFCGLPVAKIWIAVRTFLEQYTDELPDMDDLTREPKPQAVGIHIKKEDKEENEN